MRISRKQIVRKVTSYVVTFAMIATALPGDLCLTKEAKAASYGISNPRTDSDGTVTWDCVYFGNYWQSACIPKSAPANPVSGKIYMDSNGTKMLYKEWNAYNFETGLYNLTTSGYFKCEPIKWRVLSVDGSDAFLLADQNLDVQYYNTENESTTWETCTMRSWLNGYGASCNQEWIDYTSSNFLDNAFSSAEQAAISTTTVVNEDNPGYDTAGGNNTSDKVYLLSIGEVINIAYGFSSSTYDYDNRNATNTAYVAAGGEIGRDDISGSWWLRSPGDDSISAAWIRDDGYVSQSGDYVHDFYHAVRPVLHLNLNSSSVWSAAGTISLEKAVEQPTATSKPTVVPESEVAPTVEPTAVIGDVYQDGVIDGKDITLLLQYRVGKKELTDDQLKAADVYADGKVDGKDITKLLQYRVGKISSLD